jgi:hypothetical protein
MAKWRALSGVVRCCQAHQAEGYHDGVFAFHQSLTWSRHFRRGHAFASELETLCHMRMRQLLQTSPPLRAAMPAAPPASS